MRHRVLASRLAALTAAAASAALVLAGPIDAAAETVLAVHAPASGPATVQSAAVSSAAVQPAAVQPAPVQPAAAQPAPAQAAPCPDRGSQPIVDGSLPHLRGRLSDREPIRIVAIGSSSTAGAGASRPANAYPRQLEAFLQARFPARRISVVNVGVNGQEVPDMLARLDRDVLAHRPDLVIWQFGSNGLMRGLPMPTMERDAREGIARIRAAGADVMLMDLQYVPRINAMPQRDALLAMMQRLADSTGAAIFRRYALMKAWDGSLGPRYDRLMVDADQLHLNDASYRCLAAELAQSLAAPQVTAAGTLAGGPVISRAAARGSAAASP